MKKILIVIPSVSLITLAQGHIQQGLPSLLWQHKTWRKYKNKSRTSEGLIGCLLTNTCQQNRSCEDKAEGALPSPSHKSYLCWMLKKSSAFSPENDEERKSWLKCSLHSEKFIRFCYFISHKFNLKAAHSRNTSKFSQLSNANLIRFLSFFASL